MAHWVPLRGSFSSLKVTLLSLLFLSLLPVPALRAAALARRDNPVKRGGSWLPDVDEDALWSSKESCANECDGLPGCLGFEFFTYARNTTAGLRCYLLKSSDTEGCKKPFQSKSNTAFRTLSAVSFLEDMLTS